jgi:hypothetical protein
MVWMYSHPLHGEFRAAAEMKRRSGKESATRTATGMLDDGWRPKKRAGGAAHPDSVDADARDACDVSSRIEEAAQSDEDGNGGNDDILALLQGKKRKEEEEEAMRERVQEEMSHRMDTGIKANHELIKATKKLLSRPVA